MIKCKYYKCGMCEWYACSVPFDECTKELCKKYEEDIKDETE